MLANSVRKLTTLYGRSGSGDGYQSHLSSEPWRLDPYIEDFINALHHLLFQFCLGSSSQRSIHDFSTFDQRFRMISPELWDGYSEGLHEDHPDLVVGPEDIVLVYCGFQRLVQASNCLGLVFGKPGQNRRVNDVVHAYVIYNDNPVTWFFLWSVEKG